MDAGSRQGPADESHRRNGAQNIAHRAEAHGENDEPLTLALDRATDRRRKGKHGASIPLTLFGGGGIHWASGTLRTRPVEAFMPIDSRLLEILICPACHGEIKPVADDQGLECLACGRIYPIRDGIPVMLVDEASSPTRGEEPSSTS